MFTGHRPLQLTRTSILRIYYKQFKRCIKMNCFIVLHLTAIVAITMERCRTEFLLVEVNDDNGGKRRLFCFIDIQIQDFYAFAEIMFDVIYF